MDVWANWVPNFQNYDWTFNLDTPNYGLTTMMAFAFRCNTVTVTKDQENQPAYIRWDSTAKKLYCLNVRISLTYSKDTYKLVKFKRKGSSSSGWPNEIRVSLTSMKMFDGQNKALDIGQRLFGGYYALIWGNNGANLNEIIFTLPIVTTSEIEFEYILELGLCKEIDEEPYYWDNKTWTPNQLKFPSMTKYSSILTENKNDTGDAVKLPETSSATNANNYEQDENGYCYITDDEENIVYNKFLNLLARKTKINNGYRINGDQSLELISFNNNIRNNYDKQSGQYLFNGNKKQTYGSKENANQTIQKQNIPYFGGQPAIYPVLIYSTMESIESENSFSVEFLSSSIRIKNDVFSFNPNSDIVIAYIREPGTISDCSTTITSNIKKEKDAGIWGDDNLLLQVQSITTNCSIKGKSISSHKLKNDITFRYTSIPTTGLYDLNQNELNTYTKIISPVTVNNLSFQMTQNGVKFHSYGGLGDNIGFSIGKYNFPDKNDPDASDLTLSSACTWTNTFSFSDTETILRNFSWNTPSINSPVHLRYGTEDLYYTGGGSSHKISETDFYFDWIYTLSNIVPGIVPRDIGITIKDQTNNNWYTYSATKEMSDSEFSNGEDGSSSHEGYLYNIRYRNETYKGSPNYLKFNLHGFLGGSTANWRYAIAIVIWKNGKLLENS